MFRNQTTLLHFRAKQQLRKAMPMLNGRRRREERLAICSLIKRTVEITQSRAGPRGFYQRGVLRAGIGAALIEHGTDWVSTKNDLARQNVILNLRSLHNLAQMEPMAFRSLVELSSSAIPPPPGANYGKKEQPQSLDEQLRCDVARLLKPKSALNGNKNNNGDSTKQVDALVDAWKEFDIGRPEGKAQQVKK